MAYGFNDGLIHQEGPIAYYAFSIEELSTVQS